MDNLVHIDYSVPPKPFTLTAKFIRDLAQKVLDGNEINKEEALRLLYVKEPKEIFYLLAWANTIKNKYFGKKVILCSIINVKSGGCAGDCKFCAQSAFYKTSAPRYELLSQTKVYEIVKSVFNYPVYALSIVGAWKEIPSAQLLEQICALISTIAKTGRVRADASLGMVKDPKIFELLIKHGLGCYHHNLETSARFFPKICTTHSFEQRRQTLYYAKAAGLITCSGGIIGLGESIEDRVDLAFELKKIGVDSIPINILTPIMGTPLQNQASLPPLEILKIIACFRFILPSQNILIAGGRAVNLRDYQAIVLFAGASGLMIGNYLTTINRPPEEDLQMIKDGSLEPLLYLK